MRTGARGATRCSPRAARGTSAAATARACSARACTAGGAGTCRGGTPPWNPTVPLSPTLALAPTPTLPPALPLAQSPPRGPLLRLGLGLGLGLGLALALTLTLTLTLTLILSRCALLGGASALRARLVTRRAAALAAGVWAAWRSFVWKALERRPTVRAAALAFRQP